MFERLFKRLFPGRANSNGNDGLSGAEPAATPASQGHGAPPSAPIAVATMPQPEPSRRPFETNAFRFRESVMDDLYPGLLSQHGDMTDAFIVESCHKLNREYETLWAGGVVDYSSSLGRFGFLYAWEATHARQLQNVLDRCEDIHPLFDRSQIKIACIGGGPGSELHAIADFMVRSRKRASISATVCDKEPGWEECRTRIIRRIRDYSMLDVHCVGLDVRDQETWSRCVSSLQADLYVISYLVSEVCVGESASREFFTQLHANAPVGSLFLFIDGSFPMNITWIDGLRPHWRLLRGNDGVLCDFKSAECDVAMECYHGKLKGGRFDGFRPKLTTTRYTYRLFRKP